MPLLSVDDLPVGPLTPEQALTRAEELVAAAICPGLPDLSVRTWEAQYRVVNEQRAYGLPVHSRRRLGPEVLRRWPVTGLLAVTQDGTDLTASCTFDMFSIRRDSLGPEFAPLGVITVTFQTGWASGAVLPPAIRQAVQLVSTSLLDRSAQKGLAEYRVGDVTKKFLESSADGLTPEVLALLRPYTAQGV